MKILGIDPGTTRTGYGVIQKNRGVHLVACGLINGEGVKKEDRLSHLEKGIRKLIREHKPDLICLEKIFFSKNKKTASSVSEARGVILLVLQRSGVGFMEFGPSEIKSIVAGRGNASKEEVLRAVSWTLGVKDIPGPDDVSDALAIALRGAFDPSQRGS
ncbi:MAG: crossover junction endodeoxyribonuclease RuvC [Candidatus Colwellbacteria bacterium]|nr:crossover junction endodeoxyribonuclease RuvC [Candidatus Colwellbacteria bacterium]